MGMANPFLFSLLCIRGLMMFPCSWFDTHEAVFLGTVGCWIIQSRRSISMKVRSTSCWIISDSPADVIFHPMSHCKPLPFSSNWCTFVEVPGVPSLHNCFLAILTLLLIRIKYSLQRLKCYVLWMHIIWKTLCMITQCSRINGFLSIWWQIETGGECNAFSSKHTPCSKASWYSGTFTSVGLTKVTM